MKKLLFTYKSIVLLQQNDTGITMPSAKKVKYCDLLINCSSCTQEKYKQLYIGLREVKPLSLTVKL